MPVHLGLLHCIWVHIILIALVFMYIMGLFNFIETSLIACGKFDLKNFIYVNVVFINRNCKGKPWVTVIITPT